MNTNQTTENPVRPIALLLLAAVLGWLLLGAHKAEAAGTLKPSTSCEQPVRIIDHHLDVVINNGFSRTEVSQTFYNPNNHELEAIYSFPVPQSACLSEVTIYNGELEINGEVLTKADAERIYGEEKSKGNDAGLAQKNGYQTFDFLVSPVRANAEVRLRFVYYEPLKIDTGIGRYVYPLEEGGTDEAAKSFWTQNKQVENTFSATFELRCAYPVVDVRLPGYEGVAAVDKLDDGHYSARFGLPATRLDHDVVFYYRLADNLPGRVELIPYKPDASKPGTFMLIVTPGLDLRPLTGGADYVFVLDTSGSMEGKIGTLCEGVSQTISALRPQDRFRIVLFSTGASELTRGWVPATPENVQQTIATVKNLSVGGSTNLYAGLTTALNTLDDDRATSIVLVTDGVTNTGIIAPRAFHDLLTQYDVRLFGFLMGNNANWPLMRSICETSGGFYAAVSNADDIIGQIMLAKGKVTYECLHDAALTVDGVRAYDVTDGALGKVYRGQQLVLFGRYDQGGPATVRLDARLTGEDRTYETTFDFPKVATDYPEVERLWAMNRIEAIEMDELLGFTPAGEAQQGIADLGVAYQLVTDETSMVVLTDAAFAEYGIERKNKERTAVEQKAQTQRQAQPVRSHRADEQQPMFSQPAPGVGGGHGGGAVDPWFAALILLLVFAMLMDGRVLRRSAKA